MCRSLILVVLIATCWLGPVDALAEQPDETKRVITTKLAGIWRIEDGVNQGEPVPNVELDTVKMVIKSNTIITFDKDDREKYRATFTIDVTNKPFQIDMVTKIENAPPIKSQGIFAFKDDDTLKLCYALPGQARPEKFASSQDAKSLLFQCKREL